MTIQSCSYFFRIKENPSANLVEWNQTSCLPFQEGSLVRTRLRRKHNADAFFGPNQDSGWGNVVIRSMAVIYDHAQQMVLQRAFDKYSFFLIDFATY